MAGIDFSRIADTDIHDRPCLLQTASVLMPGLSALQPSSPAPKQVPSQFEKPVLHMQGTEIKYSN